MNTKLASVIATASLAVSGLAVTVVTATPADAARIKYSNCDSLHRDFKHGVSKSRAAAMKQVRDGYGRPAYGPRAKRIYKANFRSLDRDRDGTACEA